MRKAFSFVAAFLIVGCTGGNAVSQRTFDQELQLTLKAGRGELTESEKKQLLSENHPILAQVGDPQTARVVQMFSRLSEADRQTLLNDSFVKWRLVDLDENTRHANEQMIDMVMKLRTGRPLFTAETTDEQRREFVQQTEIGFAVVEIQASKQKVVSWFVFGPDLPVPFWATVVNSDAAGSPEYVQAHLERLPLLRSMKSNSPPKLQLPVTVTTSMV